MHLPASLKSCRARPSHTTVRTGPYTAVREVTLTRIDQGRETERFEVGIGESHGICFPTLVTALTANTWSSCQAVGSFQPKPAFPSLVTADDPPPTRR